MSPTFRAVLQEHHGVLKWLLQRLPLTPLPSSRSVLFGHFAKALGGHLHAFDTCVFPMLALAGLPQASAETQRPYAKTAEGLADLLTIALPLPAQGFDEALAALEAQVLALVEYEQALLIPAVESGLDAAACQDLAAAVDADLRRFMGDDEAADGRPGDPPDRRSAIEEARRALTILAALDRTQP